MWPFFAVVAFRTINKLHAINDLNSWAPAASTHPLSLRFLSFPQHQICGLSKARRRAHYSGFGDSFVHLQP